MNYDDLRTRPLYPWSASERIRSSNESTLAPPGIESTLHNGLTDHGYTCPPCWFNIAQTVAAASRRAPVVRLNSSVSDSPDVTNEVDPKIWTVV